MSLRLLVPSLLSLCVGACTDAFLERAAREPHAEWDATGLVFRPLKEGDGVSPQPTDVVRVHYRATTTEGALLADSADSGGPIALTLGSAIPCWQKSLARMKTGGAAHLVCPSYATYRENGVPPNLPRDATVVFDLDLISVEKAGTAPPVPGMAIRVLRAGNGPMPSDTDQVKVHYEGRLANGTIFDSSVQRGIPAVLPLDGVIQCWHLLVPHMHVGEKAELTCPPEVAYGSQAKPGIPANSKLTFEVELLGIEPPAPPQQ